jgi:hypothetical protein
MQNKKKIEAYYIASFDDQVDLSPFWIISDQVNLAPPPLPPTFSPSLRSRGGGGE